VREVRGGEREKESDSETDTRGGDADTRWYAGILSSHLSREKKFRDFIEFFSQIDQHGRFLV
tara:strand:+ start:681 stop:866 length:186 start_codon:yes stop_codon:yes gene_type:complete